MDFGGTYLVKAPRLKVWQALNDTAILARVIPGCEQITWRDDTSLDLKVKVNLGVMHPTFTGELELSDIEPARAYTLSGRAHGRILGLAHGAARVSLSDSGEHTLLDFKAEGGASERLLALGRPLVGASVQKVIDHFFARFGEAMNLEVTPVKPAPED